MSIVELRVHNAFFAEYEAMRPYLSGQEVTRREDPHRPDYTLIDIDMDDAPEDATPMEIVLKKVRGKGAHIQAITYYDTDRQQLAISERYNNGGWLPPGVTEAVNDTREPEAVRPAP